MTQASNYNELHLGINRKINNGCHHWLHLLFRFRWLYHFSGTYCLVDVTNTEKPTRRWLTYFLDLLLNRPFFKLRSTQSEGQLLNCQFGCPAKINHKPLGFNFYPCHRVWPKMVSMSWQTGQGMDWQITNPDITILVSSTAVKGHKILSCMQYLSIYKILQVICKKLICISKNQVANSNCVCKKLINAKVTSITKYVNKHYALETAVGNLPEKNLI